MNQDVILQQLDDAARNYVFPMLDNGFVYPGDVRMSLYRDDGPWLMVIEVLGIGNPAHYGAISMRNCLHLFGNALHRKPGTANEDFLYPIVSLPEEPLFANRWDWYICPTASALSIRGRRVPLDLNEAILHQKGITLIRPPEIDPVAVLRSLLPEYRDLLLASETELALRNPHSLPLWLRLDEWHHPDLANNEMPSQSATFQMLADAIATGDRQRYAPTLQPNTHWKNWPDGGKL